MAEAKWYVIHTYSGYEKNVKANIEKTIENRKELQDVILEARVPVEEVIELKSNGKRAKVERKLFPGYVLVNMVMNDETWYVVRNIRGVTGFVGPESKPVPLTDDEIRYMGINKGEVAEVEPVIEIDVSEGDVVTVIAGAWVDTQGIVKSVNPNKQTVTIAVDMFGRETPVEIGINEVRVENHSS